jgi:hypothetical protein
LSTGILKFFIFSTKKKSPLPHWVRIHMPKQKVLTLPAKPKPNEAGSVWKGGATE